MDAMQEINWPEAKELVEKSNPALAKFIDGLKALGVQATLIPYEDRKHGFFNAKKNQMEDHHKSITDADDFLTGLGLLSAKQ